MKDQSRTILRALLLALLCIISISCNKDKSNTSSQSQADYTIIMWGCGGGNLDEYMLYNLAQVNGYGYSDKVNFIAKLKFSEEDATTGLQYQNLDEYKGTRLYKLSKESNGLTNEQVDDADFELNNPENIADFIKEAKELMPAKKYILVLWNHGFVLGIEDQPYTKGVCWDSVNNTVISIFELEEGLKLAGGVDMVYFDACNMNMIEYIYQIKDYTSYVMSAGHITPEFGGNYGHLMYALENDSDIESACKSFIPNTVNTWITGGCDYSCDLTLVKTSAMNSVAQAVAECTNHLISKRNSLTGDDLKAYYYAMTKYSLYYYYYLPSYEGDTTDDTYALYLSVDMGTAFNRMAAKLFDGELSAKAAKLTMALNDAIVYTQSRFLPSFMSDVTMGITWIEEEDFKHDLTNYLEYNYPGQSFTYNSIDDIYPFLAFDKVTNWSNFLNANNWFDYNFTPTDWFATCSDCGCSGGCDENCDYLCEECCNGGVCLNESCNAGTCGCTTHN